MDKESIEKKIKYELELLKIYAFFIVATGTGTMSLMLHNNFPVNKTELILIVLGMIIFITFTVVSVNSFIRIKKLYKKL